MTKVCTECGQEKPIEDFHRDKHCRDGYCTRCKLCRTAYTAKWRRANRDHVRAYSRNYYHTDPKRANEMNRKCNVRRKFGLPPEQYDVMLRNQNGCCAICGRHQSVLTRALAVDHDRETGQVRDLLCGSCNTGIGLFIHDPERIERAAAYVRRHRENS